MCLTHGLLLIKMNSFLPTATSFLKLVHFTSFEDTELLPWDKAKETLFCLATTPPPVTTRICF